tara:strand:+ start:540 stop:998 length:459 start_codon:yes stop_codon:yes gene_type:complete
MTLRELFTKTSYKNTFNAIYKEYLKDYSKSKIESFSVNLQQSYDCLKNLPKKECKNIIKVENIADSISLTICDEEDCDILDFVEWENLIDCDLIAPKNLSNTRLSGLILWDITFWGFTPKQIRENKDKVSEESKKGKSFFLQEYKDRLKRLE